MKHIDKNGVDLCINQARELFNDESKKEIDQFIEDKVEMVSQKTLMKYIMEKTWENTKKAEKSKRSIRYCPIMIRFGIFLKNRCGNAAYRFLSQVYNTPSVRTLNEYDTYDGNAMDGFLHATAVSLENELEDYLKTIPPEHHEFARMVVLKFDEMKKKGKLTFNNHTNEIVDFEEGSTTADVLEQELKALVGDLENEEEKEMPTLPVAQYFLLFMIRRWDSNGPCLKRSIARYLITSSSGEWLKGIIMNLIPHLSLRGFIVVQIACDGASENVSAMKQLATLTVEDVFMKNANTATNPATPVSQNVPFFVLPSPGFKIAFEHPSYIGIYVFIGGEMPHWIKKFVNSLESSSSEKSARDLTYNGAKLSLGMIEEVWKTTRTSVNQLENVRKLTPDHFVKLILN